jgi:biopolymer transport protein ExbB
VTFRGERAFDDGEQAAGMEALNLSPIGLCLAAGLVGKFVMAVLFLASLWCWVLIVEGAISVVRLGRAVRAARAGGAIAKPLEAIATAGDEEARRRIPGETAGELRERISDAMARAARELLTRSEGGLPNLAVISSVAPFVGLFGTVWGIMSSFAAISQAQDTSLATVAPGIAEALAATAYGLAAAIPASIGYNRIGAAYARLGQTMASFVEERALALLSRPAEVVRDEGQRRRAEAP